MDFSGRTDFTLEQAMEARVFALRCSPEFRVEAGAAIAFWSALAAGEIIVGYQLDKQVSKLLLLGGITAAYLNSSVGTLEAVSLADRIEGYYAGPSAMLRFTLFFLDLG